MNSRVCPTCSKSFPDTRVRCPDDDDLLIVEGSPGARTDEVLDERYRLGLKLGEGGMGVVYGATRLADGQSVAIKLLRNEAVSTCGLERFRREAEAAASLDHPGVARALDWKLDPDETSFIVLEKLRGHTLDQLRRAGFLMDAPYTVDLLRQAALAVGAAHALGIVHRDLKPSNIFLHRPQRAAEGTIKLLDFGIAKFTDTGLSQLTMTGQFIGTPNYAAPEQASEGESTPASDVYSLGTILFEALTGRLPIKGAGILDLIRRLVDEPAPPISLYREDLPDTLGDIVGRCLRKRPDQRFPNAFELAKALGDVSFDSIDEDTSPTSTEATDPRAILGTVIADQYLAEEWLGPGRFGSQVYRAVHRKAHTNVAIRLWMPADRRAMSALIDAFRAEARAMTVRHPNLITILDFDYDDEKVYLVTEHVESVSLRGLIEKERSIPVKRCLELTRPIISAIAALHEHEIFSGALTPETIRVAGEKGEESPLVSPFGLTSLQQIRLIARSRPAEGRAIFLDYLAPEQQRGYPASPRSDVYTLALIFVELLRGCPTDEAATLTELELESAHSDLSTLELGEEWSDFLRRSLSVKVDERFSDAREMLREFDRVVEIEGER